MDMRLLSDTKLDMRLLQGYLGVSTLNRAYLNHSVVYVYHNAEDILEAAASNLR